MFQSAAKDTHKVQSNLQEMTELEMALRRLLQKNHSQKIVLHKNITTLQPGCTESKKQLVFETKMRTKTL